MNKTQWCSAGLFGVAVVIGAMTWLQRESAELLRTEVAGLQSEAREVARLRADNARLRAAQPPAEEIARLRADHVAVDRLRRELTALRGDVEKREQAIAAPLPKREISPASAPESASAASAPRETPALVLPVDIALDGALAVDAQPLDANALLARLSGLQRGQLVEVRLRLPETPSDAKAASIAGLERRLDVFKALAQERGLRFQMRIEQPAFVMRATR